jgi:very-short-patch-repair endonuclease
VGVAVGSRTMSKRDGEPKTWALLDRSAPQLPQRRFARQMRAAPTEAERKLWWHLRHRLSVGNSHFRRQVRIKRYIVDFACHSACLVVEIDGGQHASATVADAERTKILEANGYRVLRFWNNDVLGNIEGVLEQVQRALTATPTPNPPHKGEGNSPRHERPQRLDPQARVQASTFPINLSARNLK